MQGGSQEWWVLQALTWLCSQLMVFQYKQQSLGTECEGTRKRGWLLGKGRNEIPG